MYVGAGCVRLILRAAYDSWQRVEPYLAQTDFFGAHFTQRTRSEPNPPAPKAGLCDDSHDASLKDQH